MKKKDIIAMVILSNTLTEVEERNKKLEKAYMETIRDNTKLRQKIKALERRECALSAVNT